MTPEGRSKMAVRAVLERHRKHLWWYMPVSGGMGQHGIPDFIICVCGRLLAVECKAKSGAVTSLQNMQMERIRNAAGTALVVWDVDTMELESLITSWIHAASTKQPN